MNRINDLKAFLLTENEDLFLKNISEGIELSIINAKRLTDDSIILGNGNSFSSERFMATTAKEEIGKAYLLLELSRLNYLKHKNIANALVKGFYNHITKRACYEIFLDRNLPGISSLCDVKKRWRLETAKIYEGSNDEPDFPNDVVFDREMPLYVDYSSGKGNWEKPENSLYRFTSSNQILSDHHLIKELIDSEIHMKNLNVYKPKSLKIFRDEYKSIYIKSCTSNNDIFEKNKILFNRISSEIDVPIESLSLSLLDGWPIYHLFS